MAKPLDGCRALVTGGSRGLGAGIARALAADGADVGIVYRKRSDEAEVVVADIKAQGVRACMAKADVADWDEISKAVDDLAEELGGLDIVVANAGIGNPYVTLADTTPDRWRKIMSVNLDGAFYTVKAAVPHLGAGASAIFVSTVGSLRGAPMNGAYASSKAAINELTKTWAIELARSGVRVNAVVPGIFATDMTAAIRETEDLTRTVPLGRIGDPLELGRVVASLCSPSFGYLTGEVIRVDGGFGA